MFLVLFIVFCLYVTSVPNACAIEQGKKLLMVEAVLERDLDIVRWLVRHEAFINVQDEDGLTPLMHASTMTEPAEVISVLLSEGADPDLKDNEGRTALHFASELGNKEAVEALIDEMKDFSATDNHERTALHLAVNSDNEDVLSYLIKRGLDFNAKDNFGFTALHAAAMLGQTSMLEIFNDNKMDLDSETTNKTTPLILATLFDQNEAVKILVRFGSKVDAHDVNNWTALHSAAYTGNLELVKLLIEHNATLDVENTDGLTPLHLAVNEGHFQQSKYIIDKGAKVNTTDKINNTLLHGAAASGNIELVKFLIERIDSLNTPNGLGYTPLISAALEGEEDMVRLLVNENADITALKTLGVEFLLKEISVNNTNLLKNLKKIDPNFKFNIRYSGGRTLLHFASRSSNVETLTYLIDAMVEEHIQLMGSKVRIDQTMMIGNNVCLPCSVNITNDRDDEGKTALHHASEWGNGDAVDILIKHGTDLSLTDNSGLTPFHISAKFGRTDVLKKLAPYSEINLVDKWTKTAAFLSAQEGKLESLRFLINEGADTSIKDSKSRSLLHIATAKGHKSVVEELLKQTQIVSEIDNVDEHDKPSSWYAINRGYIDILKLLVINGSQIRQDDVCEAVSNNNEEFVKYLMSENDSKIVTSCHGNGTNLLHIAASNGYDNLIKHLVKYPCLVNALDDLSKSPLWYAVAEEKWHCIPELEQANGKIEPNVSPSQAVNGNMIGFVKYSIKKGFVFPPNSLHQAVSKGYTEIVKELADVPSLINARDDRGYTPLWYAVMREQWSYVNLLTEAGGYVVPSYTLEEAAKSNQLSYVKYLIRKGVSVHSNARDGIPIVYWSAIQGHTDIVSYMLDAGADIEVVNPYTLNTMVNTAAYFGECDLVRLLLRRRAYVNAINRSGHTALDDTKPECRQLLIDNGAKHSWSLRG